MGGRGGGGNLGSLLNKAVHIATPARPPPRSLRSLGGRGRKKRNYPANNNFPFLYSPSSFDFNKTFAENCCSGEDGNPVPRAEGSHWDLTGIKEGGDLIFEKLRSSVRNGTFVGQASGVLGFRKGWGFAKEIVGVGKEVEGVTPGGTRSGWSQ